MINWQKELEFLKRLQAGMGWLPSESIDKQIAELEQHLAEKASAS